MNWLVQYFEHIPSLHRALILAGGITFFWLLESIIPLNSDTINGNMQASIYFLQLQR
jgi:hypothetical protein